MRLGVMAGSVLPHPSLVFDIAVPNEYGMPSSAVKVMDSDGGTLLLLARHGAPPSIPPHEVNHRANVKALMLSGSEAIVSVCSCGALKRDIPVPCWAVPDDIVDLFGGHTFIGSEIRHITPSMDPDLSEMLASQCLEAGIEVRMGGTYVQTRGPRLETRAEVRLLSQWGDYVGMNMAPEAFLSMEAGVPFASLLTVDNHANGLMEGRLDFKDILSNARRSWNDVLDVLGRLSRVQAPEREEGGR